MNTTNSQVASMLRKISELLTLQGADRFRSMAYERAATSIEFLDRDVEDIYKKEGVKGLEAIEGIGKGIAEKIRELIETGKIKYYEELNSRFPSVTAELLTIPGVGPVIARTLVEGLKIQTIDELPQALNSPAGKKLFKQKTREKILRGYYALTSHTRRLPIYRAMPIADEILSALTQERHVMRADVVGSLRRQKETIGDIDLVATSTNPTETFNFIANLPFVKQILAKGETKITFIHNSNTQIDIEILPKENYGSLLLYLTGSKDHNIALRTLAEGKGLSLSEWGIKQDNRLITCDTESGVYKMLGMEWVPPELRENRGEVEASLRGDLPNLVEESEVRGDVHIHSNWSDGQASIAEMALAAKALGRKYIAISDHTVGLGIANGLNEEEMQNRQTEIEEANKAVRGIAILSGLEVNILSNGELDISDQVLAQIDVVTASVHGALRQSQEQITERFMKAMDNPNVDIIGHPSGRLINERPESTIDWPSFFRKAVETNTAIEINSSPYRLDLKDTLVQQARSYGVKFVITTDAHTPHELAYIKYGINVARRGWLEKSDVLNTLTLSEFLSSLK